jgi:hypothetical protein
METESQNKQIASHLKSGRSVTTLEGLYLFGSMRLSARIDDLKKMGYNIKTEIIVVTSKCVPGKKRVAKYSLVK